MANAITKRRLNDSASNTNYVLHVAGLLDTAETILLNVTTGDLGLTPKIMEVHISASDPAFEGSLMWDATTDVPIMAVGGHPIDVNFEKFGGITNNAGTGKTGDLNLLIASAGTTSSYFSALIHIRLV